MQQRSNHFFATRNCGINQSDSNTAWRYGKGNIYAPAQVSPEYPNAKANAEAIIREFFPDAVNAGVILRSEYKKGICKVSSELLASNQYPKDQYGRTIVQADGLFTTEMHIPLLNASGDAHAIVFEAPKAVGILVGAWRCLGKDIINNMLDSFAAEGISFNEINVYVGPGLGKDSYSIGMPTLADLEKVFGHHVRAAAKEKMSSHGKAKFVLDVLTLMQEYGREFGFNVFVDESKNTFDKAAWKAVKAEAIATNNQQRLIDYYANSSLFSARLYVRADRLARRIAKENGQKNAASLVELPPEVNYENLSQAGSAGRYDETGRCLNGVMRRP